MKVSAAKSWEVYTVVFGPRHKSKCGRHNWEEKGKNETKKIKNSTDFKFFSVAHSTVFSVFLK